MEFNEDLTRLPGSHREPSAFLEEGSYFGPYRIVGLLGRGGMGEVYEAEHRDLHTRHALKLINPEIVDRPDAKERFKREARVMARLRHPNIVHVDDFGELDGRIWLRMDLMNGWAYGGKTYQSLQELMRDEGALSESLVRRLLGEILDGLGFAHDAGAVHRDLKPANLLLDEKGNVKVTDFGLVSLAGAEWLQNQVQLTVARSMADPDATRLDMQSGSAGTSTQALLGTYAYMSPEQKKGSEVDARSDLYAAGLIGFQMLTGEETPGFEMPSDLVDNIDPSWDQWVRQALASRADRRFGDAGCMKESMPGSEASPNQVQPPVHEVPPVQEEPPPTPMDQEFSKLEERLAEQSAPPPDPDFVDESSAQAKELTPVQQLSINELKGAYNASRCLSAHGAIIGVISVFALVLTLAALSANPDIHRNGWFLLGSAVIGLLYWYWTIKREGWHKMVLIAFNVIFLLSINLLLDASFFLTFSVFTAITLYYIFKYNYLFGSRRIKPKDLMIEFERRSLGSGLPGVVVFLIMFVIIVIHISIMENA